MAGSEKIMKKGFTLIELLVVVAIISILSAIAVPNYLKAQTKAKVSRVQAELNTIKTALESYSVDFGCYPLWIKNEITINPTSRRLIPLTTPISYMTSVPSDDPFEERYMPETYDTYDYVDAESFAIRGDEEPSYRVRGADWRVCSVGPDRKNTYGGPMDQNMWDNPGFDYDPTNGIISKGDIVIVGSKSRYAGNYLYPDKVF